MTVVTEVFQVDPENIDSAAITAAARALVDGRLVAFPTETVYGLGANALDPAAIDRIFAAKQRPFSDPLIVHLANAEQIDQVAINIPDVVTSLAARFWPGPLTLVLHRAPAVASNVASGRNTVAVRVPAHPVAHALLVACALPIAAPSANLFSRPSPTTAQHVLDDLDGRVDIVLDGGTTTIGLESTVVDLTATPPRLLRPGGVGVEALRQLLPDLIVPETPLVVAEAEAVSSPGTLLKHYSPRASVVLLRGDAEAAQRCIHAAAPVLHERGLRLGLLLPDEELNGYTDIPVKLVSLGPAHDLTVIGQRLFARLRELDSLNVDVIVARAMWERDETSELAIAIHDRLYRAAEGRIFDADNPRVLEWLLNITSAVSPESTAY